VLSWYEQKAVAVLLTLLHLGVKQHSHRSQRLPAFLSPAVLNLLLHEKFNLMAITSARSRTSPQCLPDHDCPESDDSLFGHSRFNSAVNTAHW
jgi:hypothetical protein